MEKNSFTLFETILAITIISIVIGGFLKSSNYSNNSHINLQNIKNELIQNNSNISNNLTSSKFGLQYTIKFKTEVTILDVGEYSKSTFNNNEIFFEKYDLIKNQINLSSKVYK